MSILSNILVYKTLKLLSSKYENWSYYKDGIINLINLNMIINTIRTLKTK